MAGNRSRLEVFLERSRQIQFAMVDSACDFNLEVRRMQRECERFIAALPMYAYQNKIITTLQKSQVSILIGDTGSGKSTQVCQFLYEHGFTDSEKMVVCTQPRKVAATSLAERVSAEMKSVVGKLVGYQVGMKRNITKHTRILFSTDHCLLNECLKDPLFTKYSVLVIDEAHERSIHTDLLLGLVKKCLRYRPDLKVIITSATIDPTVFQKFFGECPVMTVPGRMFPVDVFYCQSAFSAANAYCQTMVEKITQLHKEKAAGDILAFFVTPLDCEKCSEALVDLEDAVCMPLHGQLSPEKYNEVLEPTSGGKRKIVLATNCAETSITIPGIKYVVDSGLAKEKKFDPRANISKLVVTGISKSSANQRKGRAGRVEAGECHRLYCEEDYDSMNEIAIPEILRVNLGQAVLQLIALGVNDPLSFDFVESPDKQSLQKAYSQLKHLGALKVDGALSDIGRQMVHLPLDPKYAKFVLLCCSEDIAGVPYTGIAMATMCIQGNQVFYRGGTDEERVKADAKKAKFLDERGDAFTLLKLFREWKIQPDHARGNWCFENSINSKLMNNAYSLARDIHLCLNKELRIVIHREFNLEEGLNIIQKHYLHCYFPDHIGFYSENDRAGYYIPQIEEYCTIHPSSTLNYCGLTPKIIIFENILETSRKFLITVTEIDPAKCRYDEHNWLSNTYNEQIVGEYPISTGGPSVQKELYFMRHGMKQMINDVFVNLKYTPILQWSSPNQPKWVHAVVRQQDWQLVSGVLQAECVKPIIDKLLNKGKDFKISQKSEVMVHVGAGAAVLCCVMPHEFTAVKIILDRTCDRAQLTETQLREHLNPKGELTSVRALDNHTDTLWGYANFKTPGSAESAVAGEYPLFKCTPSYRKQANANSQIDGFQGSLRVEWLRRPNKNHAFIKLPPTILDDQMFTCKQFILGNVNCIASRDKKNRANLYLRPIPQDCTDKLIRENGPEFLKTCNPEIIIPCERAAQSIKDDRDAVYNKLLPILQSAGLTADSMKFLKESEGSRFVKCFVNASTITSCLTLLDSLDQHNLVHLSRRIQFTAELKYFFVISNSVYEYLKEEIHQIAALFSVDVHFRESRHGDRFGRLVCTTSDLRSLQRLQETLSKQLSGTSIDCVGMLSRTLLANKHDAFFEKMMDDTDTLIEKDTRQHRLILYGTTTAVTDAKRRIEEFLTEMAHRSQIESVISLKGGDRPRGLMKLLLRKYKADLQSMQSVDGCVSALLDLRSHEILYVGNREGFQVIEKEIDNLAASANATEQVKVNNLCPVCLDEVDEENIQLSICGHYYCNDCFNGFKDHAIIDRKFPLCCAAEHCDQPLCVDDLEMTDVLINAAVESFVARNKDYKYCPTPDCANIYRSTNVSKTYHCSLCLRATCTCCHKSAHPPEVTCLADENSKDLIKWMAEDPANRRKCPSCGQGIEKDGGCLHVHCIKCNAHICWRCYKVYPSGSIVYNHSCAGPPLI